MKSMIIFILIGLSSIAFAQDTLRGQIGMLMHAYNNKPTHLTTDEAMQVLLNPGSKMTMNLSVHVASSSRWYPFRGEILMYSTKQEVWFNGKEWEFGNEWMETKPFFNTPIKIVCFFLMGFFILCPFFLERIKFKETTESELVDGMLDMMLSRNILSYLIHKYTLFMMLLTVVLFDVFIFPAPSLLMYIFCLIFSISSILYWRHRLIKAFKHRPKIFLSSDVD